MNETKNYYYDPSGGYYTSDPNRGNMGYDQSRGFTMNDGPAGAGSSYDSGGYDAYGQSPYGAQSRSSRRQKPEKTRTKKVIEWTRTKLACLLLAVVLLAGGAGYGGAMLAGGGGGSTASTGGSSSSSSSSQGFNLETATGSTMTVQQISKAVSDSVVEIRTESVSQGMGIQEYVTEGAGSGVVISEDGYIVTNNHVISGANKIYVTLDDSEKEYTAKLIGTDSANDIAVLKIDASGLTPAKLGDSSSVTAGDMAVVIGNPLGELGDSVSAGIISSTARKITLENQEMTLMQTDASINPGNSGGGMFDSKGQLIGIVVAKSSGTDIEGLGFAIPVNTVSKAVENIMNGGGDDTSTQQDQNSQSNQNTDQYGNGQDQYGDSQDPFGSDPYGFFDFFGF